MRTNNYRSISSFGNSLATSSSNPLTYSINDTLSQRFLHGGNSYKYGQNSEPSQAFLGQYCSEGWDGACEVASKNTNQYFPNNTTFGNIDDRPYYFKGLTSGENVIRNTAANKYLIAMGNCVPKFEPFDPTVAASPMIKKWVSETGYNNCVPVYAVDPSVIDDDVVMDKILAKPQIALDILINIYNNHKRIGMLDELKDTKVGKYFANNPGIFKQGK